MKKYLVPLEGGWCSNFVECSNIGFFRKEKNISIEELACVAGISEGDMQDIEAGQAKPAARQIFLIAKALGVRPSDLFGVPGDARFH
ncbi:helix-turn-helix domain-containing protein [Brytella acorum]|uniref:Helix-turn-helix transcriptional regulator n=1 Tax=Brytella acorum TaxID=2959299 RepID=A0AA35VAM5_9PROT|nr:helix-turn-helix transcriptional regulator [Brytella acorum]MDF3623639.1 helix-turn-helix transcriptional regulator [Brytella acorum]CAI9119943.1 helix-turn-helix transcriptional regulator [Brytella acorum]